MSNKFDADAYVERWEGRIIPLMLGVIVVSLLLTIYLNIATRPDCLRDEYIYCGTPSQSTYDTGHGHGAAHGDDAHGAPAQGHEGHAPH